MRRVFDHAFEPFAFLDEGASMQFEPDISYLHEGGTVEEPKRAVLHISSGYLLHRWSSACRRINLHCRRINYFHLSGTGGREPERTWLNHGGFRISARIVFFGLQALPGKSVNLNL